MPSLYPAALLSACNRSCCVTQPRWFSNRAAVQDTWDDAWATATTYWEELDWMPGHLEDLLSGARMHEPVSNATRSAS